MASETKQTMIEGAARLLAKNGLQGASFSEVLELTGAPRGSVYHHFPEGKDQLVAAALDLAGGRAIALLEAKAGEPAHEIARYFIAMWREVLVRSEFSAGCAVLAVTVDSDSPALLERAAGIFRTWRSSIAALLEQGGMPAADAAPYAALLVASCEGAVVVARAEHDLAPFELVAESLLARANPLHS